MRKRLSFAVLGLLWGFNAAIAPAIALPPSDAKGLRCLASLSSQSSRPKLISEPDFRNIKQRYGVERDEIEVTPNLKIPVIFRMTGHETLMPENISHMKPVRELKTYDAVVVGGGPSGLTAALYLAEAGKSVLVVERNPELGGLGMGSELKGIRAGGGAAYSAGPEGGLEYEIFRKIGLGKYKQKISIPEPIDSYSWNGKLYRAIWEEPTLKELPASFALFRHALVELADQGAGKESGIAAEWADKMTMATLVRRMPELVAGWKDAESIALLDRFKKDKRLPAKDPMRNVLDLLDLYGRSALGGPTNLISARQFIDFYESELYTRYTGTLGTGTVTEALLQKLKQYSHLVTFKTSAPVASIENVGDQTRTIFVEGQGLKEVFAGNVIYAAPMSLASKLIKEIKLADPEKYKAISEIKMTDYAVHVVRVKGHPYRSTYDTWAFTDGDLSQPTDHILGRWQDPLIRAYEDSRDFKRDPVDDYGVITIYHPLGLSNKNNFDKATQMKIVETGVQNMLKHLSPFARQNGQKIEIELVESYRWPDSIHIVAPGYLEKMPILARPVGNIRFANNTIQAPELETAMARAAREAIAVVEGKKHKPRRVAGE